MRIRSLLAALAAVQRCRCAAHSRRTPRWPRLSQPSIARRTSSRATSIAIRRKCSNSSGVKPTHDGRRDRRRAAATGPRSSRPYLQDKGTYYTALSRRAAMENWNKKLADDKAHCTARSRSPSSSSDRYEVAPAGSADLVVTFRNVHNWMGQGAAEQAFAAFYKALKPGGILGVEEHRAVDRPAAGSEGRERLRARGLHDRAGGEGRLQAGRPAPSCSRIRRTRRIGRRACGRCRRRCALGEQDRAKYQAIGEADNFLLKFQKPE